MRWQSFWLFKAKSGVSYCLLTRGPLNLDCILGFHSYQEVFGTSEILIVMLNAIFWFIWFYFIWMLCTLLSCLLSASVSLILQWFICWKENNMALVTCIMKHNVICLTTKSTSCADIQMNVWKIKINLSHSLNHIFCLHFPFHLAEHWSITACSNEQQVVKSCMYIHRSHTCR